MLVRKKLRKGAFITVSMSDSSADDAEEALHSIGAIVANVIVGEVYDTEVSLLYCISLWLLF